MYCYNFRLFLVFEIVDHSLLLQQLENSFGLSGSCLRWVSSYLSIRYSDFFLNNLYSSPSFFAFGVPQGSILGPFLLILCTSELPRITSIFSFQNQHYADKCYIFTSFLDSHLSSTISNIPSCIEKIISWCDSVSQT